MLCNWQMQEACEYANSRTEEAHVWTIHVHIELWNMNMWGVEALDRYGQSRLIKLVFCFLVRGQFNLSVYCGSQMDILIKYVIPCLIDGSGCKGQHSRRKSQMVKEEAFSEESKLSFDTLPKGRIPFIKCDIRVRQVVPGQINKLLFVFMNTLRSPHWNPP